MEARDSCVNDFHYGSDDGNEVDKDEVIDDYVADWAATTNVLLSGDNDKEESELNRSVYDHQRTIIHLDIDCFYAQVEMNKDKSLRNKPVGVRQKQIIVTSNYPAREFGVGKLIPLKTALEKCPDLTVVCGEDLTEYRKVSYQVTNYLKQFSPKVNRLGFDENYIDVTELIQQKINTLQAAGDDGKELQLVGYVYQNGKKKINGSCDCNCRQRMVIGSHIAAEMRQGLWDNFQLTSCGGIAHNKLMCKIASGLHKPNSQSTIYPEDALALLHSLEIRKLVGVGSATRKKLHSVGVTTVKEMSTLSLAVLKSYFSNLQASMLYNYSRGIDDSDVIPATKPRVVSVEDSFYQCSSIEDSKRRISHLIEQLLPRLTDGCEYPQTVKLSLRKHNDEMFKRESKQCPIPNTFYSTKDTNLKCTIILDIAVNLLRKLVDVEKPFRLRLFNVAFTNFKDKQPVASSDIGNFFKQSNSAQQACSLTDRDNISSASLTSVESTLHNKVSQSTKQHEEDSLQFYRSVPDDIDREIFGQLPRELQQELLNEWKKRSRNTDTITAFKSPKRQKKESSILQYFSSAK